MAKISTDLRIRFLEGLLGIYSPSYAERRAASYLMRMMRKMGCEKVKVDQTGNVVGKVGKGEPTMLLCGHMDTVTGKLAVTNKGGIITGRGAVDAKSALAAIVIAASELKEHLQRGSVIVAAVTREEADGGGIEALIESGIRPDWAIFGEPTGLNGVTIGYRGKIGVRLSIGASDSGHSSVPKTYANPIEYSSQFISYLRKDFEDGQNTCDSVTICPTKIKGGESLNVTPRKCTTYLDIRIPSRYSAESFKELMNRKLQDFCLLRKNALAELSFYDAVDAYQIDPGQKVVKAVVRAILEVTHNSARLTRKTGTGDLNVLHHRLGVPGVSYGPGDPRLSHTRNEYVEVEEYLKSIEVYERAVLSLTRQCASSDLDPGHL